MGVGEAGGRISGFLSAAYKPTFVGAVVASGGFKELSDEFVEAFGVEVFGTGDGEAEFGDFFIGLAGGEVCEDEGVFVGVVEFEVFQGAVHGEVVALVGSVKPEDMTEGIEAVGDEAVVEGFMEALAVLNEMALKR